jgi:choline dehydrogenase-like flavoprotein
VSRRVVVVGAGISGLATAYRLLEARNGFDVVVLEAGDAPGGKIRSAMVGGVELEAGPDSILARKRPRICAAELARRQLVARPRRPRRSHLMASFGSLSPYGIDRPDGAGGGGMSYRGSFGRARPCTSARRDDGDESLTAAAAPIGDGRRGPWWLLLGGCLRATSTG